MEGLSHWAVALSCRYQRRTQRDLSAPRRRTRFGNGVISVSSSSSLRPTSLAATMSRVRRCRERRPSKRKRDSEPDEEISWTSVPLMWSRNSEPSSLGIYFFVVMSTGKKPRQRNECNFSASFPRFLARGIDSGYNPGRSLRSLLFNSLECRRGPRVANANWRGRKAQNHPAGPAGHAEAA